MYYTCNEKHKTKSDLLNKKFLSDANVTNLSNLSIKKWNIILKIKKLILK